MFKLLIQKLNALATEPEAIDPARFNDPVALKTDWTPAKKGGTSFQTRKLVKVSPYQIEFRATRFAVFFYSIFVLGGLGAVSVYIFTKYQSHQLSPDIDFLIPIIIASIFSVAGGVLLYFGTRPIVFDKMKSAFWKGRKTPNQAVDPKALKDFVRLTDIHALQLLSEYIRGKNSYTSYELNLVRKDGSRVNVVDHGSKEKLKQDAQALSMFLNKPLWNAIP